jgi:hypothetical protein
MRKKRSSTKFDEGKSVSKYVQFPWENGYETQTQKPIDRPYPFLGIERRTLGMVEMSALAADGDMGTLSRRLKDLAGLSRIRSIGDQRVEGFKCC